VTTAMSKRDTNLLVQIFGVGVRAICAAINDEDVYMSNHLHIMQEMIDNFLQAEPPRMDPFNHHLRD